VLQTIDPLVIAEMALGAIADIAFAFALGATLLGFGGLTRQRVVCVALITWFAVQGLYLPLQASTMSGMPLDEALPAIPLVIAHSHFGLMWILGASAGLAALVATTVKLRATAARAAGAGVLAVALIIAAFAHAGTTHAADAGDFSTAELVHTVHLLATAGWAGVVVTAAWPLRRWFANTSGGALAYATHLSRVATLTFAIAIGTGFANAYRGLGGALLPLTTSLWGTLLIAKVVAVSGAILIGAINRFAYLPRVRLGDPLALPAFVRLLTMEAALMLVVLVVAAILGHSIPAATG
jgi:putative copper resistance protein D